MDGAPPLVTLQLWGVSTGALPRVLWHLAADRPVLRRTPGLRFAKLLGIGRGRTFTPLDADPHRWGLLAVWDDVATAAAFEQGVVVRGWRRPATRSGRPACRRCTRAAGGRGASRSAGRTCGRGRDRWRP